MRGHRIGPLLLIGRKLLSFIELEQLYPRRRSPLAIVSDRMLLKVVRNTWSPAASRRITRVGRIAARAYAATKTAWAWSVSRASAVYEAR
jgi:hypothetical protein